MSARGLICDFLGIPARDELQPYLRVLDCSDLMDLADMYGEARQRGDTALMQAIDARMSDVQKGSAK